MENHKKYIFALIFVKMLIYLAICEKPKRMKRKYAEVVARANFDVFFFLPLD